MSTFRDSVDIDVPKPKEQFRNYVDSPRQSVVYNHYLAMRSTQTLGALMIFNIIMICFRI